MLAINYTTPSFTDFFLQLAHAFNAIPKDDCFKIPPEHGSGFFRLIKINNHIEALLYSIKLNEEIVIKREPVSGDHYALVFDEVETEKGYKLSIDDEAVQKTGRTSALYLTSYQYEIQSILAKEVNLQGLRVLLTTEWMRKYLELKDEDLLEEYINLKASGIWHMPIDMSLKENLRELLEYDTKPLLFYQNRILKIVEDFFEWLYERIKLKGDYTGLTRNDIESAQRVEGILTQDITKLPPTIKELAREVAMSESKLKKIFKAVYGLPPYEYYQKQRMQKARIMLQSGHYSIKDVGYTLGYSNLSNFTLAFKKQYNQLPSEVLKGLNKFY